ncbi:MAG: sulfatase-like hydrolase/transferase [Gammaproteobacteria bacterium]|nr:sulfatase-like hydrolase/transferase [Gammaproteobacteria bacterium]
MDWGIHKKARGSLLLDDIFSGKTGEEIGFAIVFVIAIHILLALFLWYATIATSRRINASASGLKLLGLLVFLSAIYELSFLNTLIYPVSHAPVVFSSDVESNLSYFLFYLASALLFFVVASAAIQLFKTFYQSIHKYPAITSLLSMAIGAIILLNSSFLASVEEDIQHHKKAPNIILIGIDSLRPDQIGSVNNQISKTPHIDAFLKNTVYFEDALTPIARTYPAWYSILTGQNPKRNGARYNLIPPSLIKKQDTIAWAFREAGYQTLFAQDERRFSNIDQSYGFDIVAGPEQGAADFLLSKGLDIPLSNLLLLTPVGRDLLPYIHGNRGTHQLYKPDLFSQQIDDDLGYLSPEKPSLIVVHFTLPHWPFLWSEEYSLDLSKMGDLSGIEEEAWIKTQKYRHAIFRVDKQFNHLMVSLEKRGLLKNALVTILSDHGESLGETVLDLNDQKRVIGNGASLPEGAEELLTDNYWGHGTNILSGEQYGVLFASKGYGKLQTSPRRITQKVALMDIAPTISEAANIPYNADQYDGISLFSSLTTPSSTLPDSRYFFVESGFNLSEELNQPNPDTNKLLVDSIQFYTVNRENGLLEVRDQTHEMILQKKQRGLIYKDLILFRTPGDFSEEFTLLNKKTKQVSRVIPSTEYRKNILHLVDAFNSYYGDEINREQTVEPPLTANVPLTILFPGE